MLSALGALWVLELTPLRARSEVPEVSDGVRRFELRPPIRKRLGMSALEALLRLELTPLVRQTAVLDGCVFRKDTIDGGALWDRSGGFGGTALAGTATDE